MTPIFHYVRAPSGARSLEIAVILRAVFLAVLRIVLRAAVVSMAVLRAILRIVLLRILAVLRTILRILGTISGIRHDLIPPVINLSCVLSISMPRFFMHF